MTVNLELPRVDKAGLTTTREAEKALASGLGASVMFFLCAVTFAIEIAKEVKRDEIGGWNPGRVVYTLLRAYFDEMLALGMVGAVAVGMRKIFGPQ